MDGDHFRMHLALPREEVVAILRSRVRPERPLGWLLGGLGQSGFVGDVGPSRFRIRIASGTSPFYRLQLFGELGAEPSGSRLDVTIRRHHAADLLLLLQLLVGLVIVLAAVLSALRDPDFAPAIVLTSAILVVLMIARWPRGTDRERLRQFLLDTFPERVRSDHGSPLNELGDGSKAAR